MGMYNNKSQEFIWSSGLNNSISVFIKNNSHTYGDYKIYEKLLKEEDVESLIEKTGLIRGSLG